MSAAPEPLKFVPGVMYVDSRVGSRELVPILRKRWGLKVCSKNARGTGLLLPSADVAWVTNDDFMGGPTRIGVERKTLPDLCASLMTNRLPHHQIPQLLEDYDLSWLLVEGNWRLHFLEDLIEVPKGRGNWVTMRNRITYTALMGWLTRFDVMGAGRIRRWRTFNLQESAAWIAATYRWTMKPWKQHQTMMIEKMKQPVKALTFKANDMERIAASIPFIGSKGARKVARFFASPTEMITASVEEFHQAGVTKGNARKAVMALQRTYRASPLRHPLRRTVR